MKGRRSPAENFSSTRTLICSHTYSDIFDTASIPVCFSPDSGHDLVAYLAIERVAGDLGIEKLAKWFAERQYESAVEWSISFQHKSPLGLRPYTSTDRVNCHRRKSGWVCMVKKKFTARREVFLT
jgi:hypothetical protein